MFNIFFYFLGIILMMLLIMLPYVFAWRTKNKVLQILFGILTIISPIIIVWLNLVWSNYLSHSHLYDQFFNICLMVYSFLSVFVLIYALINIIVFKKSKKPLPIIPIVIGIIIIVLTACSYLYMYCEFLECPIVTSTSTLTSTVEPKVNHNIQIIFSSYSGWTGEGMQLTINNDGSVIFEDQPGNRETDKNKTKTTKTIQLSNKELQEIKKLVINSNVFNYKDNYDCKSDCPTDGPSEGIRFIIDGKEKIISLSVRRNTPESLEQIIGKIDSIIQERFL